MTTKFIYGKLIQRKQIKPRITRVYPTIVFAETWKWMQCAFVEPGYRDLAWRIAHEIIPTQSLLYNYNISRNLNCYLCKRQPETISHLFYECRTLSALAPLHEIITLVQCLIRQHRGRSTIDTFDQILMRTIWHYTANFVIVTFRSGNA